MADIPPPPDGDVDIMNDPSFHPPQPTRRDTLSSKAASEASPDTCRICRSEGTPDEPLFYPCKCSGSIKFVHQECLMEWLSHSHKKHCELCKTPFRFTKLYDANMPQTLPWGVFFRRACWHIVLALARASRAVLVMFVWAVLAPWMIRWVWRWLFWVADAAWARDSYIQMMKNSQALEYRLKNPTGTVIGEGFFQNFPGVSSAVSNLLFGTQGTSYENATSTARSFTWPQADPSILSSWSYVSSMTSNDRINRLFLDVVEGQIITCVVIVGFILVFLIREWVVQQQPLANLDNLAIQAGQNAQNIHENAERRRRQAELLEQARARLIELQNDTDDAMADVANEFVGWETVEKFIDQATQELRTDGEPDRARFESRARIVTQQIRAAGGAGIGVDDFSEKVFQKLAGYSDSERQEWENILVSEIENSESEQREPNEQAGARSEQSDMSQTDDSTAPARRPRMPDRNFSSRATQIQRLLAEAEEVTNSTHEDSTTGLPSSQEHPNESPSIVSAPSTDSWQEVTPPGEPNPTTTTTQSFEGVSGPVPITNAGPYAKQNIKWSKTGFVKDPSRSRIEERMLEVDEKLSELKDEVAKEESTGAGPSSSEEHEDGEGAHESEENTNPFHPDGPEPEHRDDESFGNRVASVFREEFGLDEAEELENLRQAGLNANGEPLPQEPQRPDSSHPQADPDPPSYWQRLADWFWGDIQAPGAPEPVPPADEERQQGPGDNVAPFVPVQEGQPIPNAPEPATPQPAQQQQQQQDPEVVAAAQQAGIDPEAVDDAEDLEGIMELVGLQGPLIGLFQTSAFCLLLVACTVLGAVIVPYFGGKAILSIAGSPVYCLLQLPLQVASFFVDSLIDIALILAAAMGAIAAFAVDVVLAALQVLRAPLGRMELPDRVVDYCTATITHSAGRLGRILPPDDGGGSMAWGWEFLRWSVHAHSSLRTMQAEVDATLQFVGTGITRIVETVSSGSVLVACKAAFFRLLHLDLSVTALAAIIWLREATKPILSLLTNLAYGTLTISTSETPMEPTLVYWDSTDRALAIATGYAALAALAAVYVAADTPITQSESGQRTEKMIRDTLRQAGGVLKVILIISIEMLVFPLYCGLLLDVAFLPLFRNSDVASRWAFAGQKPYLFCFVHWFVGTCYMFHFALFVGMCRKILRKGVLWFIRDPDDPTFHPVRDVLERNVVTQLRKIAFSALVYGALVILCLGGVIWMIGRVFEDIFPIYWVSAEPVLEFPLDILLYNFVTPIVIRLIKPSDAVNGAYAWWLRKCARALRLSHFLFNERKKDEEGRFVHPSWKSLVFHRRPAVTDEAADTGSDAVTFQKDGMYVLTPCNDQYRPPKPEEAFFHLDENDACIVDREGKRNDHFAKIYIPPLFRVRISLFMVCLWMFSAFAGLFFTLVPLVLGRALLQRFLGDGIRVSDIYAYSLGAYIVGAVMFVGLNRGKIASFVRDKTGLVDLRAWIEPMRKVVVKTAKCLYVYGFVSIVLPAAFAMFLHLYLILPAHTYSVSHHAAEVNSLSNSTASAGDVSTPAFQFAEFLFTNDTNTTSSEVKMDSVAEHSFHIFQDYMLGLVYIRIFSRAVLAAPASRAAEAFRRVTADGYLNPNVGLATRFFVLPLTLLSVIVFGLPPLVAGTGISLFQTFVATATMGTELKTKLYRYSYPLAASLVFSVLALAGLGKATGRWRMMIRDEAYLVGERLHNFGEKRPPVGSKSVVRKER